MDRPDSQLSLPEPSVYTNLLLGCLIHAIAVMSAIKQSTLLADSGKS